MPILVNDNKTLMCKYYDNWRYVIEGIMKYMILANIPMEYAKKIQT